MTKRTGRILVYLFPLNKTMIVTKPAAIKVEWPEGNE